MIKFIGILIFALALHTFARAQIKDSRERPPNRASTPVQSPAKSTAPRYSEVPFDSGVSQLPPRFLGHDFHKVETFAKSISTTIVKTQFETTEEFALRDKQERERRGSAILFGESIGKLNLAFTVFPVPGGPDGRRNSSLLSPSYDADSGQFDLP